MLLGLLEEGHRAEDAGAVDEHVDAAEALDRVADEVLRRLARRDVPGPDGGALAGRVEVGLRRLEHLRAGPAEDDRGALVEEAPRRRAADPTAAARDEDEVVLEVAAHTRAPW